MLSVGLSLHRHAGQWQSFPCVYYHNVDPRIEDHVTFTFFFFLFSLQPTSPHRGWLIPPFGNNPWWVYLAAAVPALLVTILIFMDQQITAVIVNRKEHKLKVSAQTPAGWSLARELFFLVTNCIFYGHTFLCMSKHGSSLAHKSLTSLTNYHYDLQVRHCSFSVVSQRHLWVIECQLPSFLVHENTLHSSVFQKGAGYHLDLFWVAILIMICSFMGLPWYVAATVISIAHIDSLKMETQTSAPGEQPKFLGVRQVTRAELRFLFFSSFVLVISKD